MILIIGGSYQGKLEYARRRFALPDAEICVLDEGSERLEANRRCLAYVERWALNRVRAGADPAAELEALLPRLNDAIVIVTDISCGVVPADPVLRAWREACGRLTARLAEASGEVWRLFCGLPQRLK